MLHVKLPYAWSLAAPILFFLYNQSNWFQNPPEETALLKIMGIYWSYIIVIVLVNGLSLSLITQRDSGFLKTYHFLAGSKVPIVAGLALTYTLQAYICLVLFTAISSILFNLALLKLLLLVTLSLLVTLLPICLLVLLIPALIKRAASAAALMNITIIILVNLASNQLFSSWLGNHLLWNLNPFTFIINWCGLLAPWTGFKAANGTSLGTSVTLLAVYVLFILIGLGSWRKLQSVSATART